VEEGELKEALAENYDAVFRFLWKMSGDEETARDLCQEVMVKAIVAFRKFRGGSSFRTWLLSIAANLYRDGLRTKRPIALESFGSGADRVGEPSDGGREAETTELRLDAERAWNLLSGLPIKKRQALVLRLEFGYSYEEIASVLHCPLGTVRSRIHEALEALRIAMGENHEA
jgi:RNA polymerase sigma-70 factor, ECF subfamily